MMGREAMIAKGKGLVVASILCAVLCMGCPTPGITVPQLVGLSQNMAEAALTQAGLELGAVTAAHSSTVPAGQVISQSPAADEVVVAASAVAIVVSDGPEPVAAPSLVGLDLSNAGSALESAGLVLGAVTEVHSDTVAAGEIISQDPAADSDVAPGTLVSLVVSLGPAPVPVPDLSGLNQGEAEAALTAAGLSLGEVATAYSATVSTGQVLSQNAAPASEVVPGTAVSVVLSAGPAPVSVPDLSGLSQAEAEAALTDVGLTLGVVTESVSDAVPDGQVLSQSPAPDTVVEFGATVSLVIARAPVVVSVPHLVGITQANAAEALTTAGLASGIVLEAYNDTVPEGEVFAQSPEAGAEVNFGDSVAYVVSLGVKPVPVPDFGGLIRSEALAALTAAGLDLGTVSFMVVETAPPGTVVDQKPAAGTEVPPGTPVGITLNYDPNFASDAYELERVWDRTTNGLDGSNGVAVDSEGNVYIADMNNHRIYVLDADGAFLREWGTPGNEDGQFNRPFGVDLSADERVYVADTYNSRVQVFTREGEHLATWDGYQNGAAPAVDFSRVFGLTVGDDGLVYVADTDRGVIVVLDPEGATVDVWDPRGSEAGGFSEAYGLAVNENTGNVFVGDSYNSRVLEFDAEGNVVAVWRGEGSEAGSFGTVHDVAVDPAGNLYISDGGSNDRVVKFTAAGEFVAVIGNDVVNHPTGVDVDMEGNVYIACVASDEVFKYSPALDEKDGD